MPPKEEAKKEPEAAAAKTEAKEEKPYKILIFFICYREVGNMKKGDYMIHVSNS